MKTLRQLIFIFLAVAGLALGVSAQKDDQKKPPKQPPPVINPGDKKPKEKPPKETKPNKPGVSYFLAGKPSNLDLV